MKWTEFVFAGPPHTLLHCGLIVAHPLVSRQGRQWRARSEGNWLSCCASEQGCFVVGSRSDGGVQYGAGSRCTVEINGSTVHAPTPPEQVHANEAIAGGPIQEGHESSGSGIKAAFAEQPGPFHKSKKPERAITPRNLKEL